MRRLLFLSNLYPPHDRGGFEQWCREVALRLRARGHAVGVLTSRYGVGAAGDPEDGVVRSLYLQSDFRYYRPADFFLRRPRQERANADELRRALERFAPDLVVVWGMWNLSRNLPYWAEQWRPGRVGYYIASYWPTDPDTHEAYWKMPANRPLTEQLKRFLRTLALAQLRREGYPPRPRFEHAVCCSRHVRDTLVQAGALPATAGVLYGGIDPAPFLDHAAADRRGPGPLRLLYFGSLLPSKGVHTAVEALGLLQQRGLSERVELTILGSGHPDYEAHLRALVAQLKICESVHFVGRVPREEIPSWLERFDVFLFTSTWPEPMARTVMEAMAAGLLVIGTEVGGQAEMLKDGQNALTFRPGDAAGLAGQIARVLDNPRLKRGLSEAGRQMVLERFTLRRMVDEIEAYVANLLSEATP